MSQGSLVVVGRFDTLGEAAVLQALLESRGIAADTGSAGRVGLFGPLALALGGVRLRVSAEHAEEALALLDAYRRGELSTDDADDDGDAPPSTLQG